MVVYQVHGFDVSPPFTESLWWDEWRGKGSLPRHLVSTTQTILHRNHVFGFTQHSVVRHSRSIQTIRIVLSSRGTQTGSSVTTASELQSCMKHNLQWSICAGDQWQPNLGSHNAYRQLLPHLFGRHLEPYARSRQTFVSVDMSPASRCFAAQKDCAVLWNLSLDHNIR